MNILLCTEKEKNNPNLNIFLNELLKTHDVTVVYPKYPLTIKRIVKYIKARGILSFFFRSFEIIEDNDNKLKKSSTKNYTLDINKNYDIIKKIKPDLIISFIYSRIIGKEILDIPKYGAINLHRGLLPSYRGVAPLYWALKNKEKYVGVTIHFMSEKIDDTERIIFQRKIKVMPRDTQDFLSLELIKIIAKNINKLIKCIKSKKYTILKPRYPESYYSASGRVK
jgi:folate-dependent phosphoribosylglycinamide formyltransferase PurN